MQYQTQLAREILRDRRIVPGPHSEIINDIIESTDGRPSFSKWYEITPLDAQYILEKLKWENRAISDPRVRMLRAAMESNDYVENNERIRIGRIINNNGTIKPILMNGNHRMHAVKGSLVPFKSEVLFYAPMSEEENKRIMFSLDRNRGRTLKDSLTIYHLKHGSKLSAILPRLIAFYRADFNAMLGATYGPLQYLAYKVTDRDCLNYYYNHQENLIHSIKFLSRLSRPHISEGLFLVMLHYHFRHILDIKKFDQVMEDIITGANLASRSIILQLREVLIQNTTGARKYKQGGIEVSRVNIHRICTATFNAIATNSKINFKKILLANESIETFFPEQLKGVSI